MVMKVRATRPGFYGKYRNEGDEFKIIKKEDMGSWMEPVDTSVSEGRGAKRGVEVSDDDTLA